MPIAVDIERLLHWAYRDELSKRATSSAESIWNRLDGVRALGVDLCSNPQRYDLGPIDPDALELERAVGVLPDATINWDLEAQSVLNELLALVDPRIKINAPARLRRTRGGWRTKDGRSISVLLEPPRQVILIHSLRTSALVTQHAILETRPDWKCEPLKPQHVPSTKGPYPKIVGECRGRNYYSTGSYCPLRWQPSPLSIAEARADYLAWWRGLARLASTIKLTKFRILQPAAAEMPWQIATNNASRETLCA
jgi:hypothetical protein